MIIGLTGKMGSGKDTIADYLVEKYNFRKVGFSDELYAAVCGLFDIDLEDAFRFKEDGTKIVIADNQFPLVSKGQFTWREFLQRFGTDMARKVWGENFWVERFTYKYLEEIPYDMVVRDIRFNNEAALINKYGGTIWEVTRPGYEGDEHESELGIHEGHIDGELNNSGTIPELHTMLDEWMETISYG